MPTHRIVSSLNSSEILRVKKKHSLIGYRLLRHYRHLRAQDSFTSIDTIPDPLIDTILGLKRQVVPFDEGKAIKAMVSQATADPLDIKPVSAPTAIRNVKCHLKRAVRGPEPGNPGNYEQVELKNSAIDAPLDRNNHDSYIIS